MTGTNGNRADAAPLAKNWVEWLVFALGLVVVLSAIGFLLHSAMTLKDSPARIEVFLGEPREQHGRYVVPIMVQNQGGKSAADVRIEVVLRLNDTAERAGFELSYSPRGSIRRGEVIFTRDPRGGSLEAHALGFELP